LIKLAPSILSADLLQLEKQINIVEKNGADFIHVDIMDGHFVPNLTFGPVIVKALNRITQLPLDVHLMMTDPDSFIPQFAAAGSTIITVHQEACLHLDRTIQLIRDEGCKPGISVNPATPINTIESILPLVDLVLIMTVNPGFGGQSFISYTLDKIRTLKKMYQAAGKCGFIEVDGGINSQTTHQVVSSGANVLVAGAAIFEKEDIGGACREIKSIAENALLKES